MNSPISSSSAYHSQILLLLPWYVNDSLATNEHRLVENHLRSCLICRRELLALRKLELAIKQTADLDLAAEASFANLRAKLQNTKPGLPPPNTNRTGFGPPANVRRQSFWGLPALNKRALAIAASVLLVSLPLAFTYQHSSDATNYHTLSAAKTAATTGGQLRVVFSKTSPDSDIDSLLRQIRAVRVDGPNSIGAYTLKLPDTATDNDLVSALAVLRNRQDVVLAEPVLQP